MRRMFGREPCSALTGCTKMTWLTNAAMAEMASVVDLCSKRDGSDRRQPYCFTGRNGNMMRPLNSHRARAVFGFFRRRLIAQKTKSSRALSNSFGDYLAASNPSRLPLYCLTRDFHSQFPDATGRRYESTKNQSQVIENNVVSRRHLVGMGNKRTASMTPT